MSAEKSILQIHLNDRDVFLLSESKADFNLHLKVLNIKDKKAYEGQASNLELRSQAANIRLSFSDYIQKAICALFQNTIDRSSFLYTLDKKDKAYVFKWKSIDSEETIINLGSVAMNERDFDVLLTDILQSLANEMQSLKINQQQMSNELNTNKSQLSNALDKLSDASNLKKNVEKELFAKFALVLNEKKRKIKDLEMNGRTNSDTKKTHAVKKRANTILMVSSSDSDEVDGDLNHPGPSKISSRNSLPFYEETKPLTQSKIRNRKAAVNKNNNIPDPPVLFPAKCNDKHEDSGSADSLMEFL